MWVRVAFSTKPTVAAESIWVSAAMVSGRKLCTYSARSEPAYAGIPMLSGHVISVSSGISPVCHWRIAAVSTCITDCRSVSHSDVRAIDCSRSTKRASTSWRASSKGTTRRSSRRITW